MLSDLCSIHPHVKGSRKLGEEKLNKKQEYLNPISM